MVSYTVKQDAPDLQDIKSVKTEPEGCISLFICLLVCLNLMCSMKQYTNILRVQTFLHHTFQVYHFCLNFIPGCICRITVNFGTLKDRILLIDIFASNNCSSDRNIFQNGVDALSNIDDAFLTKS